MQAGMFHDKITTHAGGKGRPCGDPPHGACPGRHQPRASGPPCTGPATGIMRPRTRFPESSDTGCGATRRPQTSCAPMPSRPPPEGPMTFRPCSDARADKTDLHAYDGDRPKFSHRTERRLSLAHLREPWWGRVSASLTCRYWPVRARGNPKSSSSKKRIDAGHVGDITSGASWTPLQITRLRRGLRAPSATSETPENGLEITAVTRAPHVGLAATVRDGIARSRRFRLRPPRRASWRQRERSGGCPLAGMPADGARRE